MPSSSTSGCRRPTPPRALEASVELKHELPDLGVLVLSQHVETRHTVETHTSRIFTKLGLEADPATHRRVLAVLAHLRAGSSHTR